MSFCRKDAACEAPTNNRKAHTRPAKPFCHGAMLRKSVNSDILVLLPVVRVIDYSAMPLQPSRRLNPTP